MNFHPLPHLRTPIRVFSHAFLALTLLLAFAMGPSGPNLHAQMAEHPAMGH